jgi:hypothetical protein
MICDRDEPDMPPKIGLSRCWGSEGCSASDWMKFQKLRKDA